jgi:hypothetical protein
VIVEVQAPARLTAGTFEGSVDLRPTSAEERCILNLSRCQSVELVSLVQLLTIMTLGRQHGARVEVYLPDRENVRRHLASVGFFEMLPEGVWMNYPAMARTRDRGEVVPLTRLNVNEGESAIDRLAALVYDSLHFTAREGFVEALAELGMNVIEHSEAEVGYIGGFRRGEGLELVVGDAGIGIKQSLVDGDPSLARLTDADAIIHALEDDVTSKPGTNSGAGLPSVLRYADALAGDLLIRSGKGMLLIEGYEQPESRTVVGLSGTIVGLRLRRVWG